MNDTIPIVTNEEIKTLQNNKLGALSLEKNKKTYIREMVHKLGPLWWEKLEQSLKSDDINERRMALIEYNKLQTKMLPTQLEDSDGNNIMVNIIGTNINNHINKENEKKTIDV